MADVEAALYARLAGFAGLSALVATRIYPNRIAQGAAHPAVVYRRISSLRVRSFAGPSGLARPRFEVQAWAADYDGARAVAKQVRLALDGYGQDPAADGILAATIGDERDLYDAAADLDGVSQDYTIWHEE